MRSHGCTTAHIEFNGITKRFGGVLALHDVALSVQPGSCHALMGENGAGKSTLGKILAGIHQPDAGQIRLNGEAVRLHSPRDAARHGIGMVHQELAFCPELSVAENLAMGRYPRRLGLVNRRTMRQQALELLGRIGAEVAPDAAVRTLSTAQEQLVQIAAAVGTGARILILDEPTSSLSLPESERLFELIERLRSRGVTMIYVSHRLPEVFRLADRISVLRDGRHAGTLQRAEATQDALVRLMIGRPVKAYFPQHLSRKVGSVRLRAERLSSPGKFADVSLSVRSGEIVGLAGLVGAGRSEVAQAIFGLDPRASGRVAVDGQRLALGNVRAAKRVGLGYVPEDRKRQGLVLDHSGRANIGYASLDHLAWWAALLDRQGERALAQRFYQRLNVRAPSVETPVQGLSGGNQQKVVLAKWLARELKVLIVDEPTRGVDVGAKAAIHGLLDNLAARGVAILLISSELPEVLNLASRVLVMRDGHLVSELTRDQATQETVMRAMAGVTEAMPA